jgi:DNA polymerase (family 10)
VTPLPYAAITDHSKSAGYAGGLDEERVLAQREEIRAAAALSRIPDLPRHRADILADGSIDYGDEFLRVFDLVVASVHSLRPLRKNRRRGSCARSAIRWSRCSGIRPAASALPTDRRGHRCVIDAAAQSGCALEINCSPQRLDLDWRFCRSAVDKGVMLAIDPDAHSVGELGLIPLGVGIARKGWVTLAATLNAKSADELTAWLEHRRGEPLPS